MKKMSNWVLQHKDYGLGNFVNLTPVIEYMYNTEKRKIPVFFESDYVREAYRNWEKIKVLKERPESVPLISSCWIDKTNNKEDWRHVWDRVNPGNWGDPHPTQIQPKKLAVFMNGCANPIKRSAKDPGVDIYKNIYDRLKNEYYCVAVGTSDDGMYFGDFDCFIFDNMQLAITLLSKSDIVISNDTGLYHVAGAMEKRGFILWKDTMFLKNKSPNPNFTYSQKGNWKKDFDKWISTL